MTTYVHCHIGQFPPDYLLDSMESINQVDPDSEIVLITDQEIEIDGVKILKVDEIANPQTRKVMDMQLFLDDPNPLWRRSIFRIFLVRDAIRYLSLDECYHFDSDVLMFQSSNLFSKLIDNFD